MYWTAVAAPIKNAFAIDLCARYQLRKAERHEAAPFDVAIRLVPSRFRPCQPRPNRKTGRQKPLRAIVPSRPGSTIVDIIARVGFEQLSAQLDSRSRPRTVQAPVQGTTASGMVAKAYPDGYTILVNSSAHTIAPAFYPSLGYDPARISAAVIPLGDLPRCWYPAVPIQNRWRPRRRSQGQAVHADSPRPASARRPISARCAFNQAPASRPCMSHSRAVSTYGKS